MGETETLDQLQAACRDLGLHVSPGGRISREVLGQLLPGGRSVGTLANWASAGVGPPARRLGGGYGPTYYLIEEVAAWLDAGEADDE